MRIRRHGELVSYTGTQLLMAVRVLIFAHFHQIAFRLTPCIVWIGGLVPLEAALCELCFVAHVGVCLDVGVHAFRIGAKVFVLVALAVVDIVDAVEVLVLILAVTGQVHVVVHVDGAVS